MLRLDVYVSEGCWGCRETEQMISDMRAHFPQVEMKLLDINPDEWPQTVFAVPTWVLEDSVISLGNPTRESLRSRLERAQTHKDGDALHDYDKSSSRQTSNSK